jgi:dUTP pyrophosphatase
VTVRNPKKVVERGILNNLRNPSIQIQQNGIDCTVSSIFAISDHGEIGINHKKKPTYTQLESEESAGRHFFSLKKGIPYLVEYNESVALPKDTCALMVQRTSLMRMGVQVQGSLFDSGYKGKFCNVILPWIDIKIEKHARIAQIFFLQADSASLYNGQYQGGKLT